MVRQAAAVRGMRRPCSIVQSVMPGTAFWARNALTPVLLCQQPSVAQHLRAISRTASLPAKRAAPQRTCGGHGIAEKKMIR